MASTWSPTDMVGRCEAPSSWRAGWPDPACMGQNGGGACGSRLRSDRARPARPWRQWLVADGDYRMERFAEDLADVARALGGRPVLIGASLGGLAGLYAEAEIAPGSFSSITLVDIVPSGSRAG